MYIQQNNTWAVFLFKGGDLEKSNKCLEGQQNPKQKEGKMKTKVLIVMMGMFFVLGLSFPVAADWYQDTCGDAITPIKDLSRAKVEMFIDNTFEDESPWIYLCYEMCPGSTIPGIVIWEFDADSNPATGGGSGMLGIPLPPCPCKVCSGFDVLVMETYRDQGPESAMGWCSGCVGAGASQCATRGPAVPCDQGICYELDQQCFGGPGCYLLTDECTGCAGINPPYYPLDEPCPDSSCGLPAKKGEWKASTYEGGAGGTLVDWGRDIPKPPDTSTTEGGGWCAKLPYGEILRDAKAAGASFDLDYALANPPEWQVSIYYDPVFADDDDYVTGFSVDVSDWLPEGDCNKAQGQLSDGGICHYYQQKYHCCMDQQVIDAQDNICLGNLHPIFPKDGDVDGTDASIFKRDFGRGGYTNPCPCEHIEP